MNATRETHPIYSSEDYKLLADQIENHERSVDLLMRELKEKFPAPEGKAWVIMGDRRPYQKTLQGIDE